MGGPTLDAVPSWDGHVNGAAQLSTSAPVSTENYQFQGGSSGLPGGLTRGLPNEYWLAENPLLLSSDAGLADSISVYKGLWDSVNNTVNWSFYQGIKLNSYTAADTVLIEPNIAFSPSGNIGWVAALGDLVGQADSCVMPILVRSTDGGASWGTPQEVDLNAIPGLLDSLQQYLYINSSNTVFTASSATCGFNFDLTVDANGNPHLFTIVGAGELRDTNGVVVGNGKGYVIYSGTAKFAVDITSSDGGNSWTWKYISPVSAFRSTVGTSQTISIDNNPQVSRSPDGTHIFFSWADTDTILQANSTTNSSPNLFIAGLRITDGAQTCYRQIIQALNYNFVYAPTMAPTVLYSTPPQIGKQYELPVVSLNFPIPTQPDPFSPVGFLYLGNNALICESDFQPVDSLNLTFTLSANSCYTYQWCQPNVGIEEMKANKDVRLFPNPASGYINIDLTTFEKAIVKAIVIDNLGRTVKVINVSKLQEGTLNTISIQNLDNGVYYLNMYTETKVYTKKFAVHK